MQITLDISEVHLLKKLLQYRIEEGGQQYTLEGYQNILDKLSKGQVEEVEETKQ